MNVGTHIHVPLRMNSNKTDDPLTFYLAPPSDENVTLSNSLDHDRSAAKLMTSASASANFVLCANWQKKHANIQT